MSVLGLAVGFLTLLCAGFGVTLLLLRGSAARNLLECACLSWLLGTGTVSLLLWSGGFFLSGVPLQCLVIAAALALALAGWRYRGKGKFTFPWPAQAAEWLLAGIIVLEIGAIVLLSLGQPLGWDGSFNWEIKARFAFLNHGVMPPGYYSNGSQTNSHPEYPLFIPFTQLWLDLWMGQAHQFWEKAVIPLFNAAGVLLLSLLGARLSGRRCIGGLASALLFFVPYLARGVGGITSGYLDFPLGVFVPLGDRLLVALRTIRQSSLFLPLRRIARSPAMDEARRSDSMAGRGRSWTRNYPSPQSRLAPDARFTAGFTYQHFLAALSQSARRGVTARLCAG